MAADVDVSVRIPVLVVEDDGGIRESLRAVLEESGYPVAEAATADEALAYLRAATSGHVVLLDYLLSPDQEGSTVLRAAEPDARLRRHCYVLLTVAQASRLPDDEQRLIAALCTEVVSKPFDIDDLARAVASAAARLPANP